jgi:hypothetical protein
MNVDYSPDISRKLEQEIAAAGPLRVYRPTRYDPGKVLDVKITGVCPSNRARAYMVVERFVGGGFAGQVYSVRLGRLDLENGPIEGLEAGRRYAVKSIIPPSRFARFFRNALYAVAYQGHFSAQVNQAAARVGVLWQKLVRRGARIRFGSERAVVDTYATFYDADLGAFGEINEWVDGRIWRFETDDELFRRRRSKDPATSKSPEYLEKRAFMAGLVGLFHDMGAPELARQYEWWTMKSQPNVLRRSDSSGEPQDDLVAIDFRAGLALLPFLPMSPGDFKLIFRGLRHGNLVQFDRGDLSTLERFVEEHRAEFEDLLPALNELREVEPLYRDSLLDITHHRLRLLLNRTLRGSVADGFVQGWVCRGVLDDEHADRVRRSGFAFMLFFVAGALVFPGRFVRRLWGNARFAGHVRRLATGWEYFRRSARARQAEHLIDWYRSGRVNERRATSLLDRPIAFWSQWFALGWLPAKWHRFLTEWAFARDSVEHAITYAIKFYRDPEFREQWLTDIVQAGREEGILTDQEQDRILTTVGDPFIKKYLKCLGVHLLTLPVTQVVALIVGRSMAQRFGDNGWQDVAIVSGVVVLFQILPISPGSIVRGLYTLYVMLSERDWRDYKAAILLSFWKYIGYLAFPIQMVARFPDLSRFMGGYWCTHIVHVVPIFGERGALLEHWVFDVLFNMPISLRRKFSRRRS